MNKILYDNLKKHFDATMTYEKFVNSYDGKKLGILQASKVGPTVADDIKTNSYWAVIGAMLIVGLYLDRLLKIFLGVILLIYTNVDLFITDCIMP